MSSVLKLGIVAALVGLVVWGSQKAKAAVAGFSFDVVGYGFPALKGLQLTVPLQIQFNNPTPFPINIDHLLTDFYVLKGTQYVKAGRVSQAVRIGPGTSEQTIYPTLDLASLFGGPVVDTISALREVLNNRTLQIRADVTATYGYVTVGPKSFTDQLVI